MVPSKSLQFIMYFAALLCASKDVNVSKKLRGLHFKCIRNGDFAITFDDGLSSGTEAVLDVLKNKGVRATFFINGNNYENINNPTTQEKLKRIIREGHEIGSHTWSHASLMAHQSPRKIRKEMLDLQYKVKEIVGLTMDIMRPPYGDYNNFVMDILQNELNYSVIMWNLDTNDWKHQANTNISFQAYIDTMKYATNLNSSFIALHHDPANGSEILAAKAIDYVRGKGFNLVTISKCIGVY